LKKKVNNQISELCSGDLVRVEWTDASIGKSLSSGTNVDVPVCSWGIFIGILGEKSKHIIIAQNNFQYADGFYDLDYTAIPLQWSINVIVVAKNHVPPQDADKLLKSFLMGGRRTISRRKQQRVKNHHDRLD